MSNSIDSLSDRSKWHDGIIRKYGSLEAYREQAKVWNRKGGLTGGNGLSKLTREQRSEAGKKGQRAMREKLRKEIVEELEQEMKER